MNGGRRALADEPTDGRYAGNNLYKVTSVAGICKGTIHFKLLLYEVNYTPDAERKQEKKRK